MPSSWDLMLKPWIDFLNYNIVWHIPNNMPSTSCSISGTEPTLVMWLADSCPTLNSLLIFVFKCQAWQYNVYNRLHKRMAIGHGHLWYNIGFNMEHGLNERHINMVIQCGDKPDITIPICKYSVMLLKCSPFSHKYSQKTPHSSPVRESCGVSFVGSTSDFHCLSSCSDVCNIMLYWAVL